MSPAPERGTLKPKSKKTITKTTKPPVTGILKSEAPAQCTVRMLAIAAYIAYGVKKNTIDVEAEEYREKIKEANAHGYSVERAIAPVGSLGIGFTPLAAVCFKPQDSQAPIIIAFRGTSTGEDVLADIRLGVLGVVDKMFRDEAYKFYVKIRKEYPNREIILTGHSLGGHLATYVATKAYNSDAALRANPLLQVRTFNTAPIRTAHSSVFRTSSELYSQFVNYRLSSDVVSDLSLQKYYGNTFVFPSNKNFARAHGIGAVLTDIPPEVMNQNVGTSSNASKKQNLLAEYLNAMINCYQCRVDEQIFAPYRAGVGNLEKMKKAVPEIQKDVIKGDYAGALEKLEALKGQFDGKISKRMVDVLIKFTQEIRQDQLRVEHPGAAKVHQSGLDVELLKAKQKQIKSETGAIRTQQISADNEQQNKLEDNFPTIPGA